MINCDIASRCLQVIILVIFLPLFVVSEVSSQEMPQLWNAKAVALFAVANNHDSEIAKQRIEIARSTLAEAKTVLSPQLDFSATYQQTDNPIYSFGNILNQGEFNNDMDFNDPGRTDSITLSLDGRLKLFDGGVDNAVISEAIYNLNKISAEGDGIKNELSYRAVKMFYEIMRLEKHIVSTEKSLFSIDESIRTAESRYKSGLLLKYEVLSLDVYRAELAERMLKLKHLLEYSNKALLHLLGLKDKTIHFVETDYQEPNIPDSCLSKNNPKMIALDMAIQAAKSSLSKEKAAEFPKVYGFARYQLDKGSVYNGSGDSWLAGAELKYNLYDGGSIQAKKDIAISRIKMLTAEFRKMRDSLELSCIKAKMSLAQAMEKMKVNRKKVELAQENYRLAKQRFEGGVLLSSELIEASTRVINAKTSYHSLNYERKIAVADMRFAAGLVQF